MRAWLELARPLNAAMTAAAVLLAMYAAGGSAALDPWWRPAALALTGLLFAAGANALNDATDAEVDRRAHPRRPVPSGRIAPAAARRAGLALLVASAAPAAAAGWLGVALVGAGLALEVAYETRLKRTGLPGNVAVAALTAAPFVLGTVGAGRFALHVLAFALLAALANLGREVLKDLEDAPHDEGRDTLARRSPASAAKAGAGFLLLAVALSPVPFLLSKSSLGWAYLGVVAAADAAFVVAAATRDAGRAQRVAKLAMALALVALAAGRWHADTG